MKKSPEQLRVVAARLRERAALEPSEAKKQALLVAAEGYESAAAMRENGEAPRPRRRRRRD
jgi:hypothetical protein